MDFRQGCAKIAHFCLIVVIILAILLITMGIYAISAVMLLFGAVANGFFKKECIGYYYERGENCSVTHITPTAIMESENGSSGEVIEAEWEEIK